MRIIKIHIFIFLFFISLFISTPVQKVKIEEKNGVTIITNPNNPVKLKGEPTSLLFEEDLCLGAEPSAEYMFEELRALRADINGNIIILDWGSNKILVFDQQGSFVRSFGKHGQGPGELAGPSRMRLKNGKEICILDNSNNRISYFSIKGECLLEVSTAKQRVFRAIPDSQGNFYGDFFGFDKKIKYFIVKLDPEFNLLYQVVEIAKNQPPPSGMTPILERLVYCLLPNDQLAWAVTSEYVINIVDLDGKLIRKIKKAYSRKRITEPEKELLIRETFGEDSQAQKMKIYFPKHYYPMYYFCSDDMGRLFVRTYVRNNNNSVKWDVFNHEGYYILSYFLPAEELLMDLKKNKAYVMIRANKEGLPIVKRYQLHWK